MHTFIEGEGRPDERLKGTFFTLYEAIFATPVNKEIQERVENCVDLYLILAFDADQNAAGFKIGYREDPDTFYSWLGGVLPAYRNQGLAAAMMERQHQWCRQKGYQQVRTKTMNQWRSMLLLNIKSGFDIIGVQVGRNGVPKIILEKKLGTMKQ
jgi:GNAT superfamily N-acetyltransferase